MLITIDESEHRGKIVTYRLTLAKSLRADVTATHVIDRSSVSAQDLYRKLLYLYQKYAIT